MKSKFLSIQKNIEYFLGFLTFLYLIGFVFFYKLPIQIVEFWNNNEWWAFILIINLFLYGINSLVSTLIDDYIKELSVKEGKWITNAVGIILFIIIIGIFNFRHDDSVIIAIILVPMSLLIYFNISIKTEYIVKKSYQKGWFEGFRNNLNPGGRTYQQGYEDGSNFHLNN
jgi:hypothetical protein